MEWDASVIYCGINALSVGMLLSSGDSSDLKNLSTQLLPFWRETNVKVA